MKCSTLAQEDRRALEWLLHITVVSGEGAAVGKGWKWVYKEEEETMCSSGNFVDGHITLPGNGRTSDCLHPRILWKQRKTVGARWLELVQYIPAGPSVSWALRAKALKLSSVFQAPLCYPILALSPPRLQLCQQNTHSPLDLSSVSRRKQPD